MTMSPCARFCPIFSWHLHDVPRDPRELAADAIRRLLGAATLAVEGAHGGLPARVELRPDLHHAWALRAPTSPLWRAPAGAPAPPCFGDFFAPLKATLALLC
jgi:hypothetical protein